MEGERKKEHQEEGSGRSGGGGGGGRGCRGGEGGGRDGGTMIKAASPLDVAWFQMLKFSQTRSA